MGNGEKMATKRQQDLNDLPSERAAAHLTPHSEQPAKDATTAMSNESIEAAWVNVQQDLRHSYGPNIFNSWFKTLRVVSVANGRLTMSSPTSFRRDYVAAHYSDRLRLLWRQAEPSITSIDLIVDASPVREARPAIRKPAPANWPTAGAAAARAERPAPRPRTGGPDLFADTAPNAALTFDTFVVGKCNELAYAAARHSAQEPCGRYNPLYLHCPSGFGKTHVVNAIGNEAIKVNPGLRVACVPAERFMFHYTNSVRDGDTLAFKERMRTVDILIIDDLQFICGREGTVRELTATFNSLIAAGKQIIFAADRPPAELVGIDEHFRSRLAGGLTVTIDAPDLKMRGEILRAKLAQIRTQAPRVDVPDAVLDFLAEKIDTNPRELEGALKCVAANSELMGRAISLERTEELIRHLLKSQDRRLTIEDIQKQVAAYYQVSMRDLLSHRRDRNIVRPRQVAMYLSKELTPRSLPEIGRRFGGRDHTTVLYGVRKIAKMIEENSAFADEVELLRRMLTN